MRRQRSPTTVAHDVRGLRTHDEFPPKPPEDCWLPDVWLELLIGAGGVSTVLEKEAEAAWSKTHP